jgi:hypothetical protein
MARRLWSGSGDVLTIPLADVCVGKDSALYKARAAEPHHATYGQMVDG